jgi:DNA-binding beta-propeller fold protein YncE
LKKKIKTFLRVFMASCWLLLPPASVFAAEVETLREVPSTFVYPAGGFIPFNIHRGTQTMLTLMLPCAFLKSDHDPNQPENDVVVTAIGVNSGAGEILYNVGLKDLRKFGSAGHGDKQFWNPTGVAINADGDVAVADTGNHRLAFLKHDGMRLKWVGAEGKAGTKPGEFNAPRGVAYDSQGNLYISDTLNNRIQVRDPQGRFRVMKTPPLDAPSAIAAIDGQEPWTFFQQGPYANRIAVIDREGTRLRTFSLEGAPLARVTADQLPDPPAKLWGCAFDYYGNLVATDFAKSCLRKFDKDLGYITAFGSQGTEDFEFFEPRGIAIHLQFGQILVAEKKSAQYLWNGADAVSLTAGQEERKIRIRFFLTERAYVSAEILDSAGRTVKKLAENQDLEIGKQELDWSPEPAAKPGDYRLKMRVMATYSSRDRIAKEIIREFSYNKNIQP